MQSALVPVVMTSQSEIRLKICYRNHGRSICDRTTNSQTDGHRWKAWNVSFCLMKSDLTLLGHSAPLLGRIDLQYKAKRQLLINPGLVGLQMSKINVCVVLTG